MSSNMYFNEVARDWDNMRKGFFSNVVREKAYDVAGVEKGKIATDIGAGTGFITEGLIQKGIKVIAVDYSLQMLNYMKEKFKDNQLIDCRHGEAENLPIDTNVADYAFANMYLHHVNNPPAAIQEMARIIKPGGKLVLTDLDEHNFDFLRTEHFDRWMGFKREEVENWFIMAGLKNVSINCVGSSCCTTSSSGCDSASISIFIAAGEK